VKAILDNGTYQKGLTVDDDMMHNVHLRRHKVHTPIGTTLLSRCNNSVRFILEHALTFNSLEPSRTAGFTRSVRPAEHICSSVGSTMNPWPETSVGAAA
jgi:hypothetical protein